MQSKKETVTEAFLRQSNIDDVAADARDAAIEDFLKKDFQLAVDRLNSTPPPLEQRRISRFNGGNMPAARLKAFDPPPEPGKKRL